MPEEKRKDLENFIKINEGRLLQIRESRERFKSILGQTQFALDDLDKTEAGLNEYSRQITEKLTALETPAP